jgi:Ca2+-transporting ATPase
VTTANVLVVCTAKTFTLTANVMSVIVDSLVSTPNSYEKLEDFLIDQAVLNSAISPQLQELLNAGIAVNLKIEPGSSGFVFVGSKTETMFAKELGWADYKKREMLQKSYRCFYFRANGRWRWFLKGASEILTKKCQCHVVAGIIAGQCGELDEEIGRLEIDELVSDNISRTIIFCVNQTL